MKLTGSQKQTDRHQVEERLVGKRWESAGVGMGQKRATMIKIHYAQCDNVIMKPVIMWN